MPEKLIPVNKNGLLGDSLFFYAKKLGIFYYLQKWSKILNVCVAKPYGITIKKCKHIN